MKINRYGAFTDDYRGGGWYMSWLISRGFFLIAIRPWRWHFYLVQPPGKPRVFRLYAGPIEFELSRYR